MNSLARGAAVGLLLIVTPATVRTAAACSCAENPPCVAVWRADAIFIGRVADGKLERVGGRLSWTVYQVAVSQTLRGAVDSFITLGPESRPTPADIAASNTYPGEQVVLSTCDYRFELGRDYIIYARRTPDGRWTTSLCSGTKPIDDAAGDLEYIAGLPTADSSGRVYGKIERTVLDLATHRPQVVAAPGVSVALVSGINRLTAVTDSEGKLDVRVPPGAYAIAPIVPSTVRAYGGPRTATVPSKGCAPVSFSLVANGRVEGRVVREDGTGAASASVSMMPADLADDQPIDSSIAPTTTTDSSGRFAIDAVLPGRYFLAVNARFGPRRDSPYGTTYFPGVAQKDASRPIELGEGEHKTGFTIVVSPLAEATVSAVVTFDDGRPAAGARVIVTPADHPGNIIAMVTTDTNGAFQVHVLAGIEYVISAGVRNGTGERHADRTVFVAGDKDEVRLTIGR